MRRVRTLLATGGISALLPLAAAAATEPATSSPSVAEQSGIGSAVFYRGLSGQVLKRTLESGTRFGTPTLVGGRILDAPGSTDVPLDGGMASEHFVAGRGTDGTLWVRRSDGEGWLPWISYGGRITSAPFVVRTAGSDICAYACGTDGKLWARGISPTFPWQLVYGMENIQLVSAPSASVDRSNPDLVQSLRVFATSTDHAVWQYSYTDWAWHKVGGATYDAPAAVAVPGATLVYVRGTDGKLWEGRIPGGGYTATWTGLGGILNGNPTAQSGNAPDIGNYVNVVVRSTDDALWAKTFRRGRWSGFVRWQS